MIRKLVVSILVAMALISLTAEATLPPGTITIATAAGTAIVRGGVELTRDAVEVVQDGVQDVVDAARDVLQDLPGQLGRK